MLLIKCVGLFFLLSCQAGSGQVVSRVFLINHIGYMVELIQETVMEIERRHWSSLKADDFIVDVDATVLGKHLSGTISYSNGFLVTIQDVNVLETSLTQAWSLQPDNTVRVEMQGQLRIVDVQIGWDVNTNINGNHYYTGSVRIPLITFNFSVIKNMHTHKITVTVTGEQDMTQTSSNYYKMHLVPFNTLSDTLMSTYQANTTIRTVNTWAIEVIQPIAHDLVMNKLDFPELCYDCTLTEANEDWYG
ncbi:uncharacterized protein LOC113240258 [Hyposmocoma kahamanoa]|uniref:uncharacterized protein LOC113240258 n=1 Tax=Hyposmocoma kahamanoa TaxID=1477025 RepID=UPI000E6D8ACF|nr:uncharacterized protein LOC113240258 [Hyposmocoma kahamanoa]